MNSILSGILYASILCIVLFVLFLVNGSTEYINYPHFSCVALGLFLGIVLGRMK